jgi:hypothetical protein
MNRKKNISILYKKRQNRDKTQTKHGPNADKTRIMPHFVP